MKIFLLDVDNTIAPFQPTAELYKRIFLNKINIKYLSIGYFMIILLKLFWCLPIVVEFQRKLIMSLFSKADYSELENESNKVANKVVESYNDNFKKVLIDYAGYRQSEDKIYLLTHCPDLISKRIISALKFDGEYSIKIRDYLRTGSRPDNIDKVKILQEIRLSNLDAQIYYFADDLIDVKCLLEADEGILINASFFTKLMCRIFFKKIKVWG